MTRTDAFTDPLRNDDLLRERIADFLREVTGADVSVGALKRFAIGFSWKTYLVPVQGLPIMVGS